MYSEQNLCADCSPFPPQKVAQFWAGVTKFISAQLRKGHGVVYPHFFRLLVLPGGHEVKLVTEPKFKKRYGILGYKPPAAGQPTTSVSILPISSICANCELPSDISVIIPDKIAGVIINGNRGLRISLGSFGFLTCKNFELDFSCFESANNNFTLPSISPMLPCDHNEACHADVPMETCCYDRSMSVPLPEVMNESKATYTPPLEETKSNDYIIGTYTYNDLVSMGLNANPSFRAIFGGCNSIDKYPSPSSELSSVKSINDRNAIRARNVLLNYDRQMLQSEIDLKQLKIADKQQDVMIDRISEAVSNKEKKKGEDAKTKYRHHLEHLSHQAEEDNARRREEHEYYNHVTHENYDRYMIRRPPPEVTIRKEKERIERLRHHLELVKAQGDEARQIREAAKELEGVELRERIVRNARLAKEQIVVEKTHAASISEYQVATDNKICDLAKGYHRFT